MVMLYVRYPLSLRNVEDLLHERLVVMMYVRYPPSLRNVEDPLAERGNEFSYGHYQTEWKYFALLDTSTSDARRLY